MQAGFLNGKLNATALRGPVTTGCVVEAGYRLEGEHTSEEIAQALEANIPTLNKSALLTIPSGGNALANLTSFSDNEMANSTAWWS